MDDPEADSGGWTGRPLSKLDYGLSSGTPVHRSED
jgi:hypothetical protein